MSRGQFAVLWLLFWASAVIADDCNRDWKDAKD